MVGVHPLPSPHFDDFAHTQKDPLTPITPLEPGVEMFERGRASSLFPIQTELANRKHLSVVPEVDTPASVLGHPIHNTRMVKPRPVSEVTEIFETDEDDELSQFEEDFEDIPFTSVSTMGSDFTDAICLHAGRMKAGGVKLLSPPLKKL
jgi:hypothetical protein